MFERSRYAQRKMSEIKIKLQQKLLLGPRVDVCGFTKCVIDTALGSRHVLERLGLVVDTHGIHDLVLGSEMNDA
jgi:hypothetical protein